MHGIRKGTSKPARTRVRAGKACKRCNQKRIKCDAMHHMPCTNCVQNDNAECILRETRRGTYIRKGQVQDAAESSELPTASTQVGTSTTEPEPLQAPETTTAITSVPVDDVASHQTTDAHHAAGAHQPAGETEPIQTNPASLTQSPALTQASIPHGSTLATNSPFQRSSAGSEDITSNYRDISWSTMFDHFLNSRTDGKDFVDKCSITYLGESFPLAIVLDDLNEGGRPKLHHPGPPFPESEQLTDRSSQNQSTHILPEDLEFLRTKGVFEYPDKSQLGVFLDVFLERVYPLYPIVNRHELIQQHANGDIPLILLHSICFIAVTFCPLSVLHHAGFASRREARFFYYKKVKALFDSGYEINKIVILQSAILMSFWGGGPNNYWNFYSWISTAVTMAEALGIHRSTATTNMQPGDRSLLRRLWWILVTRDSACSSLVGRPFRIDLNQSDTEMLTIGDFAHDAMTSDFLECPSRQRYARYQIEIAKLSSILRDIVMSRFYPKRRPFTPDTLQTRLKQWRKELPPTLSWHDDMPDPSNPFSMTLSVQYNHHLILIYLCRCPGANLQNSDDHDKEETMATAAEHISTVACTAVTKSNILTMPHELFHGIFLAQAVFYTKLKSPNKLLAQLGRSALTNCQMVLHATCECWDPSPWIMQLFDSLSSRRLERQPLNAAPGNHPEGTAEILGLSGPSGPTPEAGVFNGLLGYDPWQSNPMLSSLFDLPPELLLPE
ncbi:hypothetical protein P170DRAFT_415585 [Aspergillus steynii IBT 23096]|uniref:Zn(2)-C6 fungal-type domain-containing protein n=1 Tax=Aspergillus steynii IBT 23096 TaxID=1392250 RepID=A0A2I2FW09_9EURO|nr:uncharacterized protein P170DRAFT_415585 [Aspergillus steynii IBT 23096]PLB44822.1 hypothetical protein P170DRAFT_415585 [Aspergillus steynii IBT 23096]